MDANASPPPVRVGLTRVGLANVEAVIHLGAEERASQPFAARIECSVEPDPAAADDDGPRYDDAIADALREVLGGAVETRAERLAREIAERVLARRRAVRVEVAIAARFPERRPAPVSGIPTQEISTLHARAVASERGTRWMLGVSAQGLVTSPHAQRVLAAAARERLAGDGFTETEVDRALRHVPVATDDQRGVGTLHVGCPEGCAVEIRVGALLDIVEGAMSSEIFELMKRSDEGAVVERAHRRPRFAEDCVRAMIADAVERFAELPDAAFISAAQDNMETLHRHHVTAEREGTLGELRGELRTGTPAARQTSLREWLAGA